MAKVRGQVIALFRAAIRQGKSRTATFRNIRTKGLQYPTKIMLADWNSLTEFAAKDGALVHVRRNAYPAAKTLVETSWDIDGEYMFKVKVTSRLRPDEPLTERTINIVTNSPMTPAMITQAVVDKWAEYEDYSRETLETITPWTAIHTNI